MATAKTALTELGTAAGLCYEPTDPWPHSIEGLSIPGIDPDVWKPVVLPATVPGARERGLLLAALSNGRAFRKVVLGDRPPRQIEWTGADKTVWSSEIPRDLTVDEVYFIQAKHDSTCVLNTSPTSLFEHLLAETDSASHTSWFHRVAPLELQAYYSAVRESLAPAQLPLEVHELSREHRSLLKQLMRAAGEPSEREEQRYADLCQAVSERSANHWLARISRSTPGQQARMLLRMLRVASGPYWLLGTKGRNPIRLKVTDTRSWRKRFELKGLRASAAGAGQPQVDWEADVVDRRAGRTAVVSGYCEIRWSHGKLQGSPECKVQVTTPLPELPGYDSL